ncbi:MAG: hypothetical protein ACOYNI_10380, partial [Acidimicrobiia bacterium]
KRQRGPAMTRRRFRVRRTDDEQGIAIVVAMTAVFVVLSITAIAVTSTLADLASARRNEAKATARAGSERTVDNYAALIEQPGGLAALQTRVGALNAPGLDGWWGPKLDATADGRKVARAGAQGSEDTKCNQTDASGDPTRYSSDEAWNTCTKTTVKALRADGSEALLTALAPQELNSVTELTIETITRSRCVAAGGAVVAQSCTYTRFQQRLRARTYFENLILADSEALAPNAYAAADPLAKAGTVASKCGTATDSNYGLRARPKGDTDSPSPITRDPACLNAAYHADATGKDSLQGGAVHTNDDQTYVCASDQDVAFGQSPSNRGRDQFAGTARCGTTAGGASGSTSVVNRIALADTQSPLKDLATAAGPVYVNPDPTSLTRILLNDKQITIDNGNTSQTVSLPDSGVIWTAGNVAIAGTIEGRLTVRARGSIYITGDLTYSDGNRDMIGLIADGDVVFTCDDDLTPGHTADSCPPDRTVHAAIVATGWGPEAMPLPEGPYGGIYNRDWFSGATTGNPQLHFFGAMVSRYRPVFGSFEKWAPFALVNGWHKDFTYDARLRTDQPPYMLRPAGRAWDRLDLSELPCRSGATNVCYG